MVKFVIVFIGLVWFGLAGMVGMIWNGLVWFVMVCYGLFWFAMVWYGGGEGGIK